MGDDETEPRYSAADVARPVEEARLTERTAAMATVKRVFDARVKLCETRSAEYAEQVARAVSNGQWTLAQNYVSQRDTFSNRAAYLDGFLSEVLQALREDEITPTKEIPHDDA